MADRVVAELSVQDVNFTSGMQNAINMTNQLEQTASNTGANAAKMGAGFAVAQKVITGAFNAIQSSLDGAIRRFDTMQNYPRVMESLGYSADDAEASIKKLGDGIEGLPTALDDIVSSAQMLTATLDDVDKASDAAIALNDMFLAAGRSTGEASAAMQMYNKMLARGKADMEVWQSINVAAPGQLKQVAESILGAGASVEELRQQINNGTVSTVQLTDEIIRLDKEGGDGFASFSDQAMNATQGIATSLQNIKTAITKGLANTIEQLNAALKANGLPTFSQQLNAIKGVINQAFARIQRFASLVIQKAAPAIKWMTQNTKALKTALALLLVQVTGLKAIKTVSNWVEKFSAAKKAAVATVKAFNAAQAKDTAITTANTAASLTNAGATAAQAAAESAGAAITSATTIASIAKTAALAVLSGELGIVTAAQYAWNAAMAANPIGVILTATVALTGGLIALTSWLSRESAEEKKAREEREATEKATQDLLGSTGERIEASKKTIQSLKDEVASINTLADEIKDLNSVESKNADQKQTLKSKVGQLNKALEGLNLEYDEEADLLNMTNAGLSEKVDLMLANKKAASYLEIENAALADQASIAKQIAEQQKAVNGEWQKTVEMQEKAQSVQGQWAAEDQVQKYKEESAALGDLLRQQSDLKLMSIQAADERVAAEQRASEAMALSIENATVAFEDLSEANQKIVEDVRSTYADFASQATSFTDVINATRDLTIEDLQKVADANAQTTAQWGADMDALRERLAGFDGGDIIIQKLEEMGLDGINVLGALTTASDTELQAYAATMAAGATTAKDSFIQGMGMEELPTAITEMMTTLETSALEAAQNANWAELGTSITEGMTGGIEAGIPMAEAAGAQMATDTREAAGEAIGEGSPATSFIQLGQNAILGLAEGFSDSGIAVTAINNTMDEITQSVKNATKQMSTSVTQGSGAYTNATRTIKTAMNQQKQAIITGMNQSAAAVSTRTPQITSAFSEMGTKSTDNVNRALTSIQNAFRSKMQVCVNLVRNGATSIGNAFSGLYWQLYNAGSWGMQGLVSGLQSKSYAAIAVARDTAQQIVTITNSALQNGSPSKLLRKAGAWATEGLALGLLDKEAMVRKAAQKISALALGIELPSFDTMSGTRLAYAADTRMSVDAIGLSTLAEELADILDRRPMNIVTETYLDGRMVGQGITPYINEEQANIEQLNSWRKGVK